MAQAQELEIGGRTLKLSNLEKVLYGAAGFTKAHVIDYYARISGYLLPHLKDRPVTLKRYPDGVHGEFFYEKDAPAFTPDWVRTFPVPRRSGESNIDYILIDDLATLVWCANLANLEIHPFLHRVPEIDRPTCVVFDLDPGEGADVLDCARVAFLLKEALDGEGLASFPKVSGSKGLQLYVPINTPVTYGVTQPFARAIAERMEREHPGEVVAEMAKAARKGKVFIDWSQNADHKTTVAVYSLRAKRERPYCSMPVAWDELRRAVDAMDAASLYFEPAAALARVEKLGDLFAPVLAVKQEIAGAPKSLAAYARKRNFARTREPAPAAPRRSRQGSRRRFVVQKHAASHLHYDLRLEMHGVLKSWAVPKGVPEQPEEKRSAFATEDHPLEYGGGTVEIWDTGTYELIEGNYYKGRLDVFLQGRKLEGEWVLERAEGNRWTLARTGEPQQPAAEIRFVEPMQPKLANELPEGADWQYEIKLDGYRALGMKHGGEVRLLSRRNHVLNARFPEVARALEGLEDETLVDGEVVALDEQGRPSFNLLQNYRSAARGLHYYVFDVLAWRGRDLMSLPLEKRRRALESGVLAGAGEPVRISEVFAVRASDLVEAARRQGLEGLAAKRKSSIYRPGDRSGAWVKFKLNQGQELVIGGYMPGRRFFDSLLAGYYEGRKLIFVAKIKNGFTPHLKAELFARFKGLEMDVCPFANLPEPKNARRGVALTAEVMKTCRRLKPELVAQVEFTEWTAGNHLRHSRFAGLRDDKDPREVVKEQP